LVKIDLNREKNKSKSIRERTPDCGQNTTLMRMWGVEDKEGLYVGGVRNLGP
jgi:hypothetical protein